MEGFTSSNFHTLNPSFSFIDTDHQNMELHYDHNHNMMMNSQCFMGGFSNENFFSQPIVPSLDHHPFMPVEQKNVMAIPDDPADFVVHGKRKSMEVSSSTSGNSSSHHVTESETDDKKHQSSRKGKKAKASDSGDAPKEVIHVRARRGQATDSHSIAERVRRGKIKERLICLQDIVPGCSKSMGMAVMLDEIINYVQSLQNQVEFLSLKLTEASNFPNYDSDLTPIDTFQMGNLIEVMKMQRLEEREESGPLDLSFGSYPLLPYHTT